MDNCTQSMVCKHGMEWEDFSFLPKVVSQIESLYDYSGRFPSCVHLSAKLLNQMYRLSDFAPTSPSGVLVTCVGASMRQHGGVPSLHVLFLPQSCWWIHRLCPSHLASWLGLGYDVESELST